MEPACAISATISPDEPRYRNISSLKLLHEVKKMVNNESYRVVNADIVVIAEAPLLAPFIGEMKKTWPLFWSFRKALFR